MSSETIAFIIVISVMVSPFVIALLCFIYEVLIPELQLERKFFDLLSYYFDDQRVDPLDIKPAKFMDCNGDTVYVTSDRQCFTGYYDAKRHEEDMLLKIYLDMNIIDKYDAGQRSINTRISIKENSRFKKWLYKSKLKASSTVYLLE